jgi:branched-chain amino acid transport system permease protein
VPYPAYRFAIIVVGALVAILLAWLVASARGIGMLIRAGASNRRMIGALGVNIELLFSLVFGLGARVRRSGRPDGRAHRSRSRIGMGDEILILAFVIIVIGGVGSIKGAFIAAMVVGQIDIVGRAFLPDILKTFMSQRRLERRAGDLAGTGLRADGGLLVDGGRPACSASAHDGCGAPAWIVPAHG